MKKLLSVMLLALLLTGCGGEEKTTTICKGNIDEMTAAEVTIEATGDKTDVMKSTVTYDFTGYVTESTPIDTYWLPKVKSINVDYDSLMNESLKLTLYIKGDDRAESLATLHVVRYAAEHLKDLQKPNLRNLF